MIVEIDYLGQNRSFFWYVSLGFECVWQILGAILLGALLGFGLDWFLGTMPIFLIIFLILGVFASFRNTYLLVKRYL